jgi:hypothetical protein
MLKSEIRKGEAQRIQAARHAFCRRQKKSGGKRPRPRGPRQQDTPSVKRKNKGEKRRLLQQGF